MPMSAEEISSLIRAGLPGAQVEIVDLRGDGDHYGVRVVSDAFRGLSRVAQHKLVYQSLGDRMGTQLHAMALTTVIPPDPEN